MMAMEPDKYESVNGVPLKWDFDYEWMYFWTLQYVHATVVLVAYGIGRDGSCHLLAFWRSQGEGQADWKALLQDLYRRGLEGRSLGLILTDGCAGLAAAIRTVYPRVRHQRCWVHKMRNILEKARKRD
jgi:putative transposase